MEENSLETTITSLFPELLTLIFQYLPVRDRGTVAQVNSTWRDAAYNRRVWRNVVAKLHLKNCSINQNLTLFPSLLKRGIIRFQLLSLECSLKTITSIPNIKTINLSGCYNVNDTTLSYSITKCLPSLVELDLSLCKSITDSTTGLLSQFLPNITHLDIGGCSLVTANGLMYIAWGLQNLRFLNMRSCSQISDRGIGNICGINEQVTGAKGNKLLESLIIQDCQKLSDQALKHISEGLPHLKILNLSFCVRLTDGGVRFLAKMPSLRKLNVRMCQNIGDVGVRFLAEGGSKLTHLDVGFCERITDGALIYISQGLFQLQNLCICNCLITDEGIAKLVQTSIELETLNIGQCNHLTDSSLENIATHLKKLKSIDLYGCSSLTVAGLEKILHLPTLEILNLRLWQPS